MSAADYNLRVVLIMLAVQAVIVIGALALTHLQRTKEN